MNICDEHGTFTLSILTDEGPDVWPATLGPIGAKSVATLGLARVVFVFNLKRQAPKNKSTAIQLMCRLQYRFIYPELYQYRNMEKSYVRNFNHSGGVTSGYI